MNLELVEKVAAALLYEGYILYPYRPSSIKNRQRWNFGVLYPENYCRAQTGSDAAKMQTECLVKGDQNTVVDIRIRFLHLRNRDIAEFTSTTPDLVAMISGISYVSSMRIDGELFQSWQEAIERIVTVSHLNLIELTLRPQKHCFSFPVDREIEPLRDAAGQTVAVIERRQEVIEGAVEISAEKIDDQLFKLRVVVSNLTEFDQANANDREKALMNSLVSAHTILTAEHGEFVSLLETPDEFHSAARQCVNTGTWPVLVGEDGARDCMLSSPIILYDYPQIAPESAGDLFDATEIDEILTLRIMTLTEEEKREMRAGDLRARQILERTETMPEDYLMKLHGTVRGLRPVESESNERMGMAAAGRENCD